MTNFFWCATLGLCLVKLILAQIELNVTCRYAGVYHVEKNGRYSISRIEAEDLCKAFNCTLPTLEQMEKARKVGFQTCRYGFIDGHVVIPRITPNSLCAANNTGVYILPSNTSLYDTYCYNASAPEGVSCEPVTDLPSAFEGQITIGIVNPDGTRYTQKGEYRTHINETDPTLHPEDDGSSGSETNTQGSSTIIKTTYYSPDSYPDSDFYTTPSEWDMTSSPATTNGNLQDNSTQDPLKGVFHPFSFFEDKSPIPTSTPMNNVSSEVTEVLFPGAPDSKEQQTDMSDDRSASQHPTTDPNPSLGEDLVRTEYPQKSTSAVDHTRDGNLPDHTTQGPLEDGSPVSTTPMNEEKSSEDPMIFPGYFPSEQDPRHSTSSPNSGLEEVEETTKMHPPTTQHVKGRRGEKLPEDSTQDPSERIIYHSPSTNENEDLHQLTKKPHADIPNEHGTNEGRKDAEPTSAPRRRPQIPEWLIILASLLALALILAVCIAVNSRRRCGQKKKLVINRSNGAVEERKMSGLNGDASKSQEMVHLVNKEPSDERTGQDEFTVTDETRNLQNVDMKIGM
ncbi:CD44 antigen isoform X8 [Ornithorhynchus anatinus]|uniref:CD44 antigen isoform X8 n=1 Tax=Ornithorhynchus anatinus TaxID=9258 RepID=UPI0019D47A19|nr:CD44 antigen isoform X8 [Ornithorhynchus anatinus]